MVTSTFNSLALASAAATIVFIAARVKYFLLGSSVEVVAAKTLNITNSGLIMGGCYQLPFGFSTDLRLGCRFAGENWIYEMSFRAAPAMPFQQRPMPS
jgi:hypothetical protein